MNLFSHLDLGKCTYLVIDAVRHAFIVGGRKKDDLTRWLAGLLALDRLRNLIIELGSVIIKASGQLLSHSERPRYVLNTASIIVWQSCRLDRSRPSYLLF